MTHNPNVVRLTMEDTRKFISSCRYFGKKFELAPGDSSARILFVNDTQAEILPVPHTENDWIILETFEMRDARLSTINQETDNATA